MMVMALPRVEGLYWSFRIGETDLLIGMILAPLIEDYGQETLPAWPDFTLNNTIR
jgi:hypothetical protein